MRVKSRNNKDVITIYWTPGRFLLEEESWNILYREPEPLINRIYKDSKKDSAVRKCPAARDSLRNIFVVKSNHNEVTNFPEGYLKSVENSTEPNFPLELDSTLGLLKERNSEYENYVNLSYNMSWFFFASESLNVKITSPYYPPISPTEGSALFPGEFDIGMWYRPFNAEYLIPTNAKSFVINQDDPIFYIDAKTDKKVVFQRYNNSKELMSIAREVFTTTTLFGKSQTMSSRYKMFSRSNSREILLNEIRKNIIPEATSHS
jgi:hypothetical protein